MQVQEEASGNKKERERRTCDKMQETKKRQRVNQAAGDSPVVASDVAVSDKSPPTPAAGRPAATAGQRPESKRKGGACTKASDCSGRVAEVASDRVWARASFITIIGAVVVAAILSALHGGGAPQGSARTESPTAAAAFGGAEVAELLRRKEQALSAVMQKSFPVDHNLPASRRAGLRVSQGIVHEVLMRRERQMLRHTIKRAVSFHFAGDANDPATPSDFAKMTGAIVGLVLGESSAEGALHLGEDARDWENPRQRVAEHLAKHPNAVVVLHRADRAPTERLYDLEDAFETPHLQHDGVLVKSSGAVFILQTSLGSALTSHICGDRACEAHHKADLIRYVKEQSQLHWTRQAKLDPEYARPITAHTLMF